MILHLSYQTPVSLLSANQSREGNSVLREINLGPVSGGNHNTWLICVCHCSSLLRLIDSLTQTERSSHNTAKKFEIKGTYSGWLGLETWPKRLSKFYHIFANIFCLIRTFLCFFCPQVKKNWYSNTVNVCRTETPLPPICNETPMWKIPVLRKGCFAEETDMDSFNTHSLWLPVSACVVTNLGGHGAQKETGK